MNLKYITKDIDSRTVIFFPVYSQEADVLHIIGWHGTDAKNAVMLLSAAFFMQLLGSLAYRGNFTSQDVPR